MIEREQEKENSELKEVWGELGHAVRYVYREAGTGISDNSNSMPDQHKMKEHVHRWVCYLQHFNISRNMRQCERLFCISPITWSVNSITDNSNSVLNHHRLKEHIHKFVVKSDLL